MTVRNLTGGVSGFFVDLAANDAVQLSNTLMLERDYGWSGLCIEPNPIYWKDLARRRCKLIAAAVGNTNNEVVNFAMMRREFGGIVGKRFDNKYQKPGTAVLHTVSLIEVFKRAHVPSVIDYMSFDVEGAETFIASSFPWNEFTVKLMTVERPDGALKAILKNDAHMVYLKTHGRFGDEMWCHESVEVAYRALL